MKILFAFSLVLIFSMTSIAQKINPGYDSTLAKKFGADDYGMKTYILVILKTGSNTTNNKTLVDSLFAGHLKNIMRLVDENKLIVAGPLVKNEKLIGEFLFSM